MTQTGERLSGLETKNPDEVARMVADVVRTNGSWGLMTTFYERGEQNIGGIIFEVGNDGFYMIPLGGPLRDNNLFGYIETATREKTQPPELASNRMRDQLVIMAYDIEPKREIFLAKELAEQTAIIIQTPKADEWVSLVAVTLILPSKSAVEVLKYMTKYPRFGLSVTDELIPGLDAVSPRTLDLKTLRIIRNMKHPFLPGIREKHDRTIEIPLAK